MFEYVAKCFRNYVGFSGRARRSEFWFFFLFEALINLTFSFFYITFLALDSPYGMILISSLQTLFSLGIFLPGLAVTVRRLHDINKGWGWIFINAIIIVGNIWFLVLMCKAGTAGPNGYGEDPKATDSNQLETTN